MIKTTTPRLWIPPVPKTPPSPNISHALMLSQLTQDTLAAYQSLFDQTAKKRLDKMKLCACLAGALRASHEVVQVPQKACLIVDQCVLVVVCSQTNPISINQRNQLKSFLVQAYFPLGILLNFGTLSLDYGLVKNQYALQGH